MVFIYLLFINYLLFVLSKRLQPRVHLGQVPRDWGQVSWYSCRKISTYCGITKELPWTIPNGHGSVQTLFCFSFFFFQTVFFFFFRWEFIQISVELLVIAFFKKKVKPETNWFFFFLFILFVTPPKLYFRYFMVSPDRYTKMASDGSN